MKTCAVKKRRRVIILCGLIVLIGMLSLLLIVVNVLRTANRLTKVECPATGYAFPLPAEIVAIKVRCTGSVLGFEDFLAPASQWPAILAALMPSQYDPEPAAWQGLARLEFQTRDGIPLCVDVFWVPEPSVGAFAVDAPPPHGWKYYRGGRTKQFMAAIIAARQLSREAGETIR